MAIDAASHIRASLERALGPVQVSIDDESASHVGHPGAREGGHYRVRVVSDRFQGLGRIARHRLVYEAIGPLRPSGIHALAIEAWTVRETAP